MARNLDIIIFGATGFTGKHVIPIIHKLSKSNNKNLTWGVAGRNEKKLKDVLTEAEKTAGTSFQDIPCIVASIEDEKSLNDMAAKARIIINCCGPYRFYGEPVIKACVESGTHHVDVSGEPEFIEKMQLKYDKGAQEKGIYIISACGFDSIPTDLGVVFLEQKFGGTLNSVVTFLEGGQEGEPLPGPSINYGTWHSAVYGLASAKELGKIRRQLYPERLPSFKPKLQAKTHPHKSDIIDGWILPFLGSDKSVVKRSQRFFYDKEGKRPVQIETYFIIKSFLGMLSLIFCAAIFGIFAKYQFTRNLLLKFPELFSFGFFSHKEPSEEKLNKTWFSVTLYGEGWKEPLADPKDNYTTPVDKAVIAKVKGTNPGYGATCIALALAGITVITETNKLPPGGGVFAPGAAFAKTTLIQQLNSNGLTFEILSEKDLK